MVWFRVDDDLTWHPRVTRAGNAAMGLWLRAGTWCSEHLTDGFIGHDDARALGSAAEIKKLVAVGLWYEEERDGEHGYLFHRWNENGIGQKRQPTRAEVEADRRASRERQAKARSRRDTTVTHADVLPESQRPDPTRPDPTRPKGSDEPSLSPDEPAKRKRPIPKDFAPTDEHRAYAHEHHLDVEAEVQSFRDHAVMTGRQGIDWNAGFRNWLKKGAEMSAARQPKTDERPMRRFT